VRAAGFASNSGRICLDRLCHNAYNERTNRKSAAGKRKAMRHLLVAILVGRRIAGGG
jgi:hypothetical protein